MNEIKALENASEFNLDAPTDTKPRSDEIGTDLANSERKTSGLEASADDVLDESADGQTAKRASARFRLDSTPKAGSFRGARNQSLRICVFNELSHVGHASITTLGNRDSQVFNSPSTAENTRAGQTFGHFKKDRLVGSECFQLSLREHFDRGLERRGGDHGSVLQLTGERALRSTTLRDTYTNSRSIDVSEC